MKFESAVEGYWLEKRRNVSQRTVMDYSATFRRFGEFLGPSMEFDEIKPDHVRKFLTKLLNSGLSPKTVNNAWIALSSLWTWAEVELDIPHIIRKRVARPKFNRATAYPNPSSFRARDRGCRALGRRVSPEWMATRHCVIPVLPNVTHC